MFKQKSVWAQLGMGAKGRDGNGISAPIPVSEDAQAKNTRDAGRGLIEFAPQSRDRNQLPQRPSTSAGPASSFTKRRNAEKRETKDDLHFNPLAAHGKGTTFYNFPLPGALPTPATTPRSSPPPPREAELARPSTPDSMEIAPMKMEPPPTEIGMALGSPAHPTTIFHPEVSDSYHEYMRNSSPEHVDGSVDGWVNSPPMVKRKPSRWKTLGGLFGGKKNTQAFYQLQPEIPQPLPAPEQYVHFDENQQSDKSSMYRGQTKSERKSKKNKPDMKRANTAPLNFDFADQNQYQNQPPEITLEGERLHDSGSTHTTYSGGLLDIDIPSVHMERYSIMFSGVLQKSGSTTTSSSLLARRQATLDKLKTVNEAIASKEQELYAATRQQRSRRASSPQAKSPAFSLFPSTPSRTREASPSPYRSNLQRSNTSPAMLSPARPSFAPGPENDAHAKILTAAAEAVAKEDAEKRGRRAEVRIPNLRKREPVPEPVKEPVKEPVREEIMDSPTIVSPNPKWSTEESHLTLDSPSDEAEECEVEDTYSPAPLLMKPVLPEPHWQMIRPAQGHVATSSNSGSTTSRSDHSTSTSASSIMTSPSVASPLPSKQVQAPPTGRSRAATMTGAPPSTGRMRSATSSSASQIPCRNPNNHTAYADEDEELRLKTAADVSIARQISVSRSQRQLLVPIKSALKQPKNPNLSIEQRNFPVPASGIGAIGVGRVASPLGAVAVAAQEERERAGSPLADRGERARVPREKKTAERLVEGVKPITPTLVVVGNSRDEKEKLWQGATQQQHLAHSTPVGLAERRRGNNNGHLHLSNTGEIKVGLAVEAAQAKELQNRKSERVVVERISVASN